MKESEQDRTGQLEESHGVGRGRSAKQRLGRKGEMGRKDGILRFAQNDAADGSLLSCEE